MFGLLVFNIIVIILIIGFIAAIYDAISDYIIGIKNSKKTNKQKKYYEIVSDLTKEFVLKRNELYSGNKSYYSPEFEQDKKELNNLASDIVNLYCRCLNDGDYESAKVLMNIAESTCHIYEGDKYPNNLLEEIMRIEASKQRTII